MYTDREVERFLKRRGVEVPQGYFLLLDERCQQYSVGHRDRTQQLHFVSFPDAVMAVQAAAFLRDRGVPTFGSLDELLS